MVLDRLNPMRKNISSLSVDEIIWDWNIKNFTRLPERPGEFITSPHFTVGNNREIWALKLYPRGEFEDNIDYVSLYLQLVSAEKLGITVKFQLSMLKFDEVLQSKIINTKFANFLSVGCEKFASRSHLERSCQYDDSLVIVCRIKVTSPGALINRSLAFDGQKYRLCNDFGGLLSSHEFTDVVLIAEKTRFPAHKVVLSARSPVFAAMFKHKEMRENVENEVTIQNIRPIVVKAMLEFIYRGEVAGIENLANDLLAAADR
uniref:BTB domain-containing protein n=1 Tax=Bracon brevicornis TaxID=1563983 RepID=A0A6V7KQ41_9HYME